MYRIIICGSRNFNDLKAIMIEVDKFVVSNGLLKHEVEIVSGSAKGADKLGELYAKIRGYQIKKFPANWNKYGKRAGFLRNEQMVKYANQCFAFWDGKSKGTQHTINLCNLHNLPFTIIRF